MSSEYTPTSGRRSSRRGGRRSSRPQGGSSRPRQEAPAKPQKKTLWQKIAAFFSGDSSKDSSKTNGSYGTTTSSSPRTSERSRSERPARAERTERTERAERPSGFRKPEIVEVSSPRIYVGNLSFDASESDLFELFNGVGSVQNVEVVSNKHTQKSKGFAFVQMQSVDEAKRAVSELHDKEYMGRKLVVSGAKAVDEKRSDRQRQSEPAQESEPVAQTEGQPESQ
jgi:RNA recognition motif-containing protein